MPKLDNCGCLRVANTGEFHRVCPRHTELSSKLDDALKESRGARMMLAAICIANGGECFVDNKSLRELSVNARIESTSNQHGTYLKLLEPQK
jgi:hypothetical protein